MSNTKRIKPPAPGLQGDYRGTCITCMQPTDTGLGIRGSLEWLAGGLAALGVPVDEAMITVEYALDEGDLAGLGGGRYEMPVRVCGSCVSRANPKFPAPVLAVSGAKLPTITQE